MRKNVEQMALGQKEKVRSLQYFVRQSQWETETVIAIHQGLIGGSLGEEDGVILVDEQLHLDSHSRGGFCLTRPRQELLKTVIS